MALCGVCGRREGTGKCPECGGVVCDVCVREGICWNCWAKRKEEQHWNQPTPPPEPTPTAASLDKALLEFSVNYNTGTTLIEGSIRFSNDQVHFMPTEVSDIVRTDYALDIPTNQLVSCSTTYASATLVNGFCLQLTQGRQHCFVCDNAQAVFEAVSKFLANRPIEARTPSSPQRHPMVFGRGARMYRCPQCEEENWWSAMICEHCNCPLPAHSPLTGLKVLYSDQPCLILLIAVLLGMGLLAVIIRLVVR